MRVAIRHGGATRLLEPEVIGLPECPLFHRWTLWDRWGLKVLVHHFMPSLADPDIHDHPRPFVTFVLRGGYIDTAMCSCQRQTSYGTLAEVYRQNDLKCPDCRGDEVVTEIMRAPKIRFRAAEHAHSTATGKRGAWTVVVMGPMTRPWGFWRDGSWYPQKLYAQIFGFRRQCD